MVAKNMLVAASAALFSFASGTAIDIRAAAPPSEPITQAKVDAIMASLNNTAGEKDLVARDDQCNVKGCVGALFGLLGASVGCAATGAAAEFDAPVAAIVCGGTLPPAIGNTVLQCQGCELIGACPDDDDDARSNACDWRGGQTRLGPNQCLQHHSSVPNPSHTDALIDGNLVVHCHNTATVEQGGGAGKARGQLCHKKCNQCQQCAGHDS